MILINNAGISMRANFNDVDLGVLKKEVMDTNFWGAVYCTKYALPYLLKQKGTIIGISSISGLSPLPGRTGYSASKKLTVWLYKNFPRLSDRLIIHVIAQEPNSPF